LPVPGGPINRTPLGNFGADGVEAFGFFEEGYDFLQFFFSFFDACYVVEHHAGFGFHLETGSGFAEVHGISLRLGRSAQDCHQHCQHSKNH